MKDKKKDVTNVTEQTKTIGNSGSKNDIGCKHCKKTIIKGIVCKHCEKPITETKLVGFSIICPLCGKPQDGEPHLREPHLKKKKTVYESKEISSNPWGRIITNQDTIYDDTENTKHEIISINKIDLVKDLAEEMT